LAAIGRRSTTGNGSVCRTSSSRFVFMFMYRPMLCYSCLLVVRWLVDYCCMLHACFFHACCMPVNYTCFNEVCQLPPCDILYSYSHYMFDATCLSCFVLCSELQLNERIQLFILELYRLQPKFNFRRIVSVLMQLSALIVE
jgi:hypothetical protein